MTLRRWNISRRRLAGVAAGVVVATGVGAAAVLPAYAADDAPAESQMPQDTARMHELMMENNPGMARMHELMTQDNPGMARMHQQMMEHGAGHDGQ